MGGLFSRLLKRNGKEKDGNEGVTGKTIDLSRIGVLAGSKEMPFVDALNLANKQEVTIVSNADMDIILKSNMSELLNLIRESAGLDIDIDNPMKNLIFPTGTIAIYEEPGKKLGESIEYIDHKMNRMYMFVVPEGLRGKKNRIILVNHPNFEVIEKGNIYTVQIDMGHANLFKKFPTTNGMYGMDEKYTVPIIKSPNRASLVRKKDGAYIGPVYRTYDLATRNATVYVILSNMPTENRVVLYYKK